MMKSTNNFQCCFPFILSLSNLFVNSQMSERKPVSWTGDMNLAHISYLPGPNGNINGNVIPGKSYGLSLPQVPRLYFGTYGSWQCHRHAVSVHGWWSPLTYHSYSKHEQQFKYLKECTNEAANIRSFWKTNDESDPIEMLRRAWQVILAQDTQTQMFIKFHEKICKDLSRFNSTFMGSVEHCYNSFWLLGWEIPLNRLAALQSWPCFQFHSTPSASPGPLALSHHPSQALQKYFFSEGTGLRKVPVKAD